MTVQLEHASLSTDHGSPAEVGSEMHVLARHLRQACEQDNISIAPGIRSIADRLDSIANYVADTWSAREAADLHIARIRDKLSIRRSPATLLYAIVAEPEKVHSRENLGLAVGCSPGKVIEVYVCSVRAALRQAGLGYPIQTKSRLGYWMSHDDAAKVATLWQR